MGDPAGEGGARGEAALIQVEVGGQGEGPVSVRPVAGQRDLTLQVRRLPIARGDRQPLNLNDEMNKIHLFSVQKCTICTDLFGDVLKGIM